jgi:3-methyladenine DNA glycosylase AlkD
VRIVIITKNNTAQRWAKSFMHKYIEPLAKLLKQHENAESAVAMKSYMKNRFEFFGIKSQHRNELFKQFFTTEGLPKFADLEEIILELFNQPQRELHYFAIELAGKFKKCWTRETLGLFEKMITMQSWWDSADYIKSVCLKPYFLRFTEETYEITQRWIDSENIWLQRLSVIFQLGFKDKTDVDLLFHNILQLTDSKEFFVQKAIGWALRDYARIEPDLVKKFVAENNLKPLSVREALKYFN